MPKFEPNQPEYYPGPGIKGYQMLNDIMGGAPAVSEEYQEVAYQNEENLKAFLYSCLPYKADKASDLKELINKIPELKVDSAQTAARRQMSEKARQVIADVSAADILPAPSSEKTVSSAC